MLKRIFDLVVALSAAIFLLPAILLVAVVVRLGLGAPILFTQVRPGLNGRPFRIYKFRSMLSALGPDGAPLPDDVRLTKLGKFLRKTSLDELPQLWNVIVGDVSLVGPRPLLMDYLPLYDGEQGRRHEVRPGVTGWAQVNGRNAITWERKFELDVWYVDNRSFLLDLKIMALTVKKVVGSEGISAEGTQTMPRFEGRKLGEK